MGFFEDLGDGFKDLGEGVWDRAGKYLDRADALGDAFVNFFKGVSTVPDALAGLLKNPTFLILILLIGGVVVIKVIA